MTDTSQLTQYQVLRLIAETTGVHITLRRYESVRAWRIEDDVVFLVLNRVQYKEGRRSDKILKYGATAYEWRLKNGSWHAELPITVWWDPDTDYVEHFHGPTFEEQRESYLWAVMCERPGSARYPMDWMQSARPLEY